MSTHILAGRQGVSEATRVVQLTYSHPTRVVRAECRLVRGDSVPSSSGPVDAVLLERFGSRATVLLPAHFPDHAKRLIADAPDCDWVLECTLFGQDGQPAQITHAQWLSKYRYFYPDPNHTANSSVEAPGMQSTPSGGTHPTDLTTWNIGTLPARPGGTETREYAAWFFVIFDSHAQSDLFETRWDGYGSAWFPLRSVEAEFRKNCIERLLPPLVSRIAARHARAFSQSDAEQEDTGAARTHTDFANRPLIAYVSQLQLSIIDLFYPTWRTDGVERSGLAQAFEWFASGELLVRMYPSAARNTYNITDGAPSGPFIFMFAEFAMMAIDHDIDAHAWAKLLPLLSSIQEIYWHAFGEYGVALPSREYRKRHLAQSPRPISDETLHGIRKQRFSRSDWTNPVEVRQVVAQEISERLLGMFSDGYRPSPVDWSDPSRSESDGVDQQVEAKASRSQERA
ncbi:MAG: hypothetical protein ACF8MJ_11335 [Phycisphaerales bacterium JB050]